MSFGNVCGCGTLQNLEVAMTSSIDLKAGKKKR